MPAHPPARKRVAVVAEGQSQPHNPSVAAGLTERPGKQSSSLSPPIERAPSTSAGVWSRDGRLRQRRDEPGKVERPTLWRSELQTARQPVREPIPPSYLGKERQGHALDLTTLCLVLVVLASPS